MVEGVQRQNRGRRGVRMHGGRVQRQNRGRRGVRMHGGSVQKQNEEEEGKDAWWKGTEAKQRKKRVRMHV